ncbi:hypothetical protein [Pedobacter hiemivivus]|uniref:Uncharacterized protein n=1 Tax=Pedobacter hiemivivus TaxID=2530454 RepID=A0A4R0NBL0_9SPHI|nr:hypothetical protein [Pedobacter hiemivivus]TCC97701.1 hypothetical protein EZ444_07230 [Pedobacter hiemivivus]
MKNIIPIMILFVLSFNLKGQTLQSVTDNGNTTTNKISINTAAEGLSLLGNSYLSFKDIGNISRNGYIQHDGSDLVISPDLGTIRLYGKVGVGSVRAYGGSTLHVKATNPSPWAFLTESSTNQCIIGMSHTGSEGVIAVSYLDDSGFTPLQFMTSNIPRMTIAANGNIGIGTADPKAYKLAVNGKIRAQEIKVEASPWPDYVFTKSYYLPSLQETEKYIKEKGHLPGIPSAAEVKANGIDLGEMNAKLLQKIEELTLHLIEKDKNEQKQHLLFKDQNKMIEKLIERLESLEKRCK